ncbi:GIY-YIG nuclease family protein [Lichenibacterium dinghuense]|uniref:GIY-YIG nuclease family protein n=1 Tax=Lichenibacterium dinghuense TaxID=2895977 RepID=UPI001F480637|nr:GIY-YIG nuclease family protein [Lichenibacterium sp. 6Y81]
MPYSVYILASKRNGTLYTGVTNDLGRRVDEHRNGRGSDFVRRYGVVRLVWAEAYDDVVEAIAAEKRIKRWHRRWKLELIEKSNPDWQDLSSQLH